MDGYTIGFIVEGALALILLIALIAVCVKVSRAKRLRAEAAATEAESHEKPAEDGDDIVRFSSNEMTFNEAYEALSEEQKRYFTNIREYALSKQDAEERLTKNGVTVYVNNKVILKLRIRRGITVAFFKLENDLLRDYRRNSDAASAIRLKETEIYFADDSACSTACEMVDLMLEQHKKEQEEAARRRKERRAERRAAKKAEPEQALTPEEESAPEDVEENAPADTEEEAPETPEAEDVYIVESAAGGAQRAYEGGGESAPAVDAGADVGEDIPVEEAGEAAAEEVGEDGADAEEPGHDDGAQAEDIDEAEDVGEPELSEEGEEQAQGAVAEQAPNNAVRRGRRRRRRKK